MDAQLFACSCSIKLTVDTCGHLVPGANRAAMDRLPTVEDPLDELEKLDAHKKF